MGPVTSVESRSRILRDAAPDSEARVAQYPGELAIGAKLLSPVKQDRNYLDLALTSLWKVLTLSFRFLVILPLVLVGLLVKTVIGSIVEIFSDDSPDVSLPFEDESKVQYQRIDTRE